MPARDRASTVPLHHIDEGSGGPALLFIHGWLRSTADWSKQARAFRGRHRVIRVDLRGHGRSPRSVSTWSASYGPRPAASARSRSSTGWARGSP